MKISSIAVCVITASQIALAQENITKIVRVRGDANEMARYGCVAGVVCNANEALKAVVLNGPAEIVARAEQNIKELENIALTVESSSKKNVETTVYVIAGSAEGIPGAQEVSSENLSPVIRQLRPIFPYAHYQLVSSMLLRSANESGAVSEGIFKSLNQLPEATALPQHYKVQYRVQIVADNPQVIHFKDLQFEAQIPFVAGQLKKNDGSYATTQYQRETVSVRADFDVREGQKVVVGKANVSDSDNCFFIVVSARLVP